MNAKRSILVFAVTAAAWSFGSSASALGSATLTWRAPTTDTQGRTLTDLSGFVIRYGTSPTNLSYRISIPSIGLSSYVVEGLTAGTWYFGMKAITTTGTRSALSNIVTKKIG